MRKILIVIAILAISVTSYSQNVGIGTTTPAAKLDVNSTSNYVGQFNGIAPMYLGLFEGGVYKGYLGSYSGLADDIDIGTGAGNATGKFHLTIQAAPRLTVGSNGNVGIGTTTPIGRLDVIGAGTTSTTNTFVLRNSVLDTIMRVRDDGRMGFGYNGASYGRTLNFGGTGVNFYTTNEAAFGGAIFPTDTSLIIWSNSGANNYLVLQPSWGNTGIGTYTPNTKLHLNGNMLIGGNTITPATGYSLSVDGKIICEEARVQLNTAWPDYVFSDGYKLMPIEDLEKSIRQNRHLPNIPSAAEVTAEKGFDLGDMNKRLLEKVEELTLYIIELNKQNKAMSERIKKLEEK